MKENVVDIVMDATELLPSLRDHVSRQCISNNVQSGAAFHSQGFEDKNLGSSPGPLGQ